MKIETTAKTLLMCALITLSSCTKKPHTPTEEPQPAEVGFTAASQAVWVKGDEGTTETPTFPYDDFGAWGIARQGDLVYNLWGNNALMKVAKDTSTGFYKPDEAAYWIKDYAYSFLAVAPYFEDDDEFGITSINQVTDALSFTFDMADRYTDGEYEFDLLGAAIAGGPVEGGRTSSQELIFWHILSQVNVDVTFSTDLAGEAIVGRLTKITLTDVYTEGQFTISPSSTAIPNVLPTCPIGTNAGKVNLEYTIPTTSTANEGTFNPDWTFHIIPQVVKDMGLYLDFEINEGTSTAPQWVEYKNIRINLNVDKNQDAYAFNGSYNWRIILGTGASIKFEVSVTPWANAEGYNPETDM